MILVAGCFAAKFKVICDAAFAGFLLGGRDFFSLLVLPSADVCHLIVAQRIITSTFYNSVLYILQLFNHRAIQLASIFMNKFALLLIAAVALGCHDDNETKSDASTGTWTHLNDFPAEGRHHSFSFSINGKGYWGFGANSTANELTEVWEYDPAKDSWQRKKDFPYDPPAEAVAVVNNKAYFLMNSGQIYEYDPAADAWKLKLTTVAMTNFYHAVGFGLGNDAYFGTGFGLPSRNEIVKSKSFWKYNVEKNILTPIADLPGGVRQDAVSFVIGGDAYVGNGYGGATTPPFHTDFYRYDGTTWHAIAELPEAQWHRLGLCFVSKDKGYVGLLMDGNKEDPTVFEYDPAKDSWRQVAAFPSRMALQTESFLINDRTFVIGGWWTDPSSQVWEFVP